MARACVARDGSSAYGSYMVKATARKAAVDTRAPKRPVNLTLDAELVRRARAMSGNLSAQLETLLLEFVEKRAAEDLDGSGPSIGPDTIVSARLAGHSGRDPAHADRAKRAARSWNEFAERHGSFADEFSTL